MIQSFLITGIVVLPILLIILILHWRRVAKFSKTVKNPKCETTTKAMLEDAKLTTVLLFGLWLIYFGTYLIAFTDFGEVYEKQLNTIIAITVILLVIAVLFMFTRIKTFFANILKTFLQIISNYNSKRRFNRISKRLSKSFKENK